MVRPSTNSRKELFKKEQFTKALVSEDLQTFSCWQHSRSNLRTPPETQLVSVTPDIHRNCVSSPWPSTSGQTKLEGREANVWYCCSFQKARKPIRVGTSLVWTTVTIVNTLCFWCTQHRMDGTRNDYRQVQGTRVTCSVTTALLYLLPRLVSTFLLLCWTWSSATLKTTKQKR